ncbi:hypothetical protein D8B26_006065 [Coccidioides posadasii str. Silveira]|uniref:Uncharacterized protein n=1 Tax=Coccidioides posadasii (strain RMSCC 757 / Silveira) TaxID=443226 RepID=E9DBT5_COCPS|nr:conserved hypothetical protein [Coccidioides posadasii str. Silveira]QVM11417.1 hypothetical protein D8B26_006065 [Coccidioides posadasii str. Silveira]
MAQDPEIVLFHYTFSPYARRVAWYLNLRGIRYSQCLQPPIMPRPDLAALGVQYRRIPVLMIGKDIFCDSRLIIQKLEERFPAGKLGADDGDGKAIEKLIDIWTTDGGVFGRAAQLIPMNTPLTSDPKFIADRLEFSNRKPLSNDSQSNPRGEGMVHAKQAFDIMETTLLADGRDWILKTGKPTLADIQGVWVFDWMIGLKGALDPAQISEQTYPITFAWVSRFRKALSAARSTYPMPRTLTGKEALDGLSRADFAEPEGTVDPADPLKLEKGDEVLVFPTDTGVNRRDRGHIVALNAQEVVLQRKTADNRFDVRLHFPRTNFRILKVDRMEGGRL